MSECDRAVSKMEVNLGLWFVAWLGGAVWVFRQPGYGFWDALFWLYYVGRFVAQHFTALTPQ